MKKAIFLFLITCFFITSPQKVFGQFNVDLQVFQPLPEVEFAAFLMSNNLSGAPRIFVIRISPHGEQVKLEGTILWKKNESASFEELYYFLTKTFTSRDISNDEIGSSDIKIDQTRSNSSLQNENINKGKPTGTYRLEINLLSPDGEILSSDQEELNFLNPAQTLTIRTPAIGSSNDVGGIIAEWDQVLGVSSYKVKANIRQSASQSLEEALNSGNPIINNKDVGNTTIVNLRDLLDREWLPGQEIVLQVSGVVPGPSGGKEIFSDIINFYLDSPDSPYQKSLNKNIISILETLPTEMKTSGELLDRLLKGDVEIVEIIRENGTKFSRSEIDELVKYLLENPGAVVSLIENN